MKNELIRRLAILENKKIPQVSARLLRSGGMQSRLHRQEILMHGKEISKQKNKIKNKLSLIEQQESSGGFGGFSTQSIETLEDFDEPILTRVRSKRGFF